MDEVTEPTRAPYPAVPDLDFLRDLADAMEESPAFKAALESESWDGTDLIEKVRGAYRYLLWSRRCFLLNYAADPEGNDIAFGMMLKYSRVIFDIKSSKAEDELIEASFRRHKERIARFKAVRR